MNNDSGYNRALNIIMEANKHRPIVGCCSPSTGTVGPTGPTGPQGPVTVSVVTTSTGAPGTEASVINTGTSEDVVLAFTIPAGATGPTGPTGATGPQGLAGETPILTIGTVTTGAPGTDAEATITGTAPNFILNLVIPQGPTGPVA